MALRLVRLQIVLAFFLVRTIAVISYIPSSQFLFVYEQRHSV